MLAGGTGCGDDGVADEVLVSETYLETFTEVRDCRPNGGSHSFNQIRVLVDDVGLVAYRDRSEAFPVGSTVIKEEFASQDTNCTGEIVQWSAMRKLAAGNEDLLNWRWQQVDFTRHVVSEDDPRCIGCHAACVSPDGYDGTCTVP